MTNGLPKGGWGTGLGGRGSVVQDPQTPGQGLQSGAAGQNLLRNNKEPSVQKVLLIN